MVGLCNEEMGMRTVDEVGVVSSASCRSSSCRTSISDRQQQPSHLPVPPYNAPPTAATAADMQQYSPRRVMSSSTSDVQSAADPCSPVVSPQQVPGSHAPPVNEWSQSLTRGSTRIVEDRLGVWAPNTAIASSMPSIPRECAGGGPGTNTCQPAAEQTISTKDWLDALHRNNVQPVSRSTDQMHAVSFNHSGGPPSLAAGSALGSLGLRAADGFMTPSRSTLAGSEESFAVSEAATSRHSLNSRESLASQNGRSESVSSKKRRVRFELQQSSVQRAPDQRQRPRSRSDKGQRTLDGQAVGTERISTVDDDIDGRTTARASGSLFSKFRRVVDGVGALLGLSKQKNNVEDSSEMQPTCNGHLPANSFDDMTEMERLATVADRVASERLHSVVLHGKLPTHNGYRAGARPHGHPELSVGDQELDNIEACLAGLSISSVSCRPPEQVPSSKQQQQQQRRDFESWGGNSSSSVSEELHHLPSNACSSYVQFMPKSTTVPCSIGNASDREHKSNCTKPSASSSMGNVVLIECQCGSGPMAGSEPMLPTANSDGSRTMVSHHPGACNSERTRVQANSHPYAEPSSVFKSAPALNSQGQAWQRSSVTAGPQQDVQVRKSTSDFSRVQEKPQPPSKVFLRSSSTSFREGLLPTPAAGVEDFRIRRQAATTNQGPHGGPMKATVPFSKQPKNSNGGMSSANATRLPPPPPPTRSFAAADVCGLSVESESETHRLMLQELSALVDNELQQNERLDLDSDVVETRQPLNLTAKCGAGISTYLDPFRVISSSTSSSKPAAVPSKTDVDAQLKSLGFDEDIWNLELDELVDGSAKKLDDDEEDSASTLTDRSGSVVTVTSMTENQLSTSTNDVVSGCGSVESVHSVDDPFPQPPKLGSTSSCSLPAISDVSEARPADADPVLPRRSSTNIPLSLTCRDDVRGRRRSPVAFSFNQLASGTTATAACSPYNSKSSGIGSLFDSGSVPNSPL